MQGKTYNYKITYNSISKIFLLDHLYGTYFVISLRRPITQGQQRYPHLVMSLTDKDEKLELNISEEELEDRYENQLTKTIEGPLPKVIARLFKILSGKKIFIPGSFRSVGDLKSVKCALKASNGHLYPLNQSLFFVHKPATFIRYEDIDFIEFLRLDTDPAIASMNKFFDLEAVMKKSESSQGFNAADKYVFNNISKSEFPSLYEYLKNKGIHIKNLSKAEQSLKNINAPVTVQPKSTSYAADVDMDSDSDDSDFDEGQVQLSSSSSESEDGSASDDSSKEPTTKKQKISSTKSSDVKSKKSSSSKSNDKPSKRKKPKKDPKYPKRAKSPYIFYMTKTNHIIKEKNPTMTPPDVMRKVGENWKALTDDEKKEYVELAKTDKERYEKQLAEYEPSEGFDKKGKEITK